MQRAPGVSRERSGAQHRLKLEVDEGVDTSGEEDYEGVDRENESHSPVHSIERNRKLHVSSFEFHARDVARHDHRKYDQELGEIPLRRLDRVKHLPQDQECRGEAFRPEENPAEMHVYEGEQPAGGRIQRTCYGAAAR